MIITLSPLDVLEAEAIAFKRYCMNRLAQRPDTRCRRDFPPVVTDVEGALYECAVVRALKIPWTGAWKNEIEWQRWRKEGHDVGPIEVRGTRWQTGRLLLHPNDPDHSPFLLIRGHRHPTYQLIGWCFGREGKQKAYWWLGSRGRPCYRVRIQSYAQYKNYLR